MLQFRHRKISEMQQMRISDVFGRMFGQKSPQEFRVPNFPTEQLQSQCRPLQVRFYGTRLFDHFPNSHISRAKVKSAIMAFDLDANVPFDSTEKIRFLEIQDGQNCGVFKKRN